MAPVFVPYKSNNENLKRNVVSNRGLFLVLGTSQRKENGMMSKARRRTKESALLAFMSKSEIAVKYFWFTP
jgi:hypothetical protein